MKFTLQDKDKRQNLDHEPTLSPYILPEVHDDEGPVKVQMDGDEEQAVAEDVHILGPVLHCGVATRVQLGVEVGVHGVHLNIYFTH